MAKQLKPLTRAQKVFLSDIVRRGDECCHPDYPPAKALIARGLVTHEPANKIGAAIRLRPTEAGKAVVA